MTLKQKAFVKEYVNTLNGTQAALKAYDTTDPIVAKSIACENLTKPYISDQVNRLLDKKGLTNDRLFEELEKKLTCTKPIVSNGKVYQTPDNAIQLKAIELAAKLKNLFPKDTLEVTGKDGGELVIKIKEDRELIEVREGETEDYEEQE